MLREVRALCLGIRDKPAGSRFNLQNQANIGSPISHAAVTQRDRFV